MGAEINPKATFDHLLYKANSKKAKASVKISLTKPEGLYIWPLSGAASKLYHESLKVQGPVRTILLNTHENLKA